jgi:hypothetical protein
MSLALALLRLYTPTCLKTSQLAELFRYTAAAFGVEPPATAGLSFEECLREYARFTAIQAEAAVRRGDDLEALRARLYRNAFQLGQTLRKRLRVSSVADAMAATRVLYRGLRIELRGPHGGEIEVARCFFSRFYSAEVCQVVSALDAGVVAGLSEGGRLIFYERITEGRHRCRARFEEAVA